MRNHRCGWQDEGPSFIMKAVYNSGALLITNMIPYCLLKMLYISFFLLVLKRYVLRTQNDVKIKYEKFYLTSPSVFLKRACFRFSFIGDGNPSDLIFLGRLFIFVQRLNNNESYPVWSEDVYYSAQWNHVFIQIVVSSGEYKVFFTV